jgi:hypothetical protein
MPAAKTAKSESLESIYDSLHELLSHYVPSLKIGARTVRAKRNFHLTVPQPLAIPGAYGGKPVDLDVASLILQKDYVGFYFMPVYMQPALKKNCLPRSSPPYRAKPASTSKSATPIFSEMSKMPSTKASISTNPGAGSPPNFVLLSVPCSASILPALFL